MNNQRIALLMLAPLLAAPASAQQSLDWQSVGKLAPGTLISVKTHQYTACAFQRATEDKLFCSLKFKGSDFHGSNGDRTFDWREIRDVHAITMADYQSDYVDYSKGFLVLTLAAGAGGGWDSARQPTSFAGVKAGMDGLSLDLQYDRLNAQNGFSVEGSGVLPLFRVPAFRPKNDRLLFKLFAEPGFGYRAGPGPFGQYASAKALVLLGGKWLKDGGPSPYIEFQRRFPFNSPLDGDNRITVGFMFALCEQCGVE